MKKIIKMLRDPVNGRPLSYRVNQKGAEFLVEPQAGKIYPIHNGIPDFLHQRPVSGLNLKYQKQYDLLSPFYNFATKTAIFLMGAKEADVRRQYLCELEIKPGMQVLEVSVGTGTNLCLLPRHAHYFGLDISRGQLDQCRKNLKKIGLTAHLFLCDAENLPFCDNQFDVVFHMGGINFFSDPAQALQEMVRVAKPGSKIVVVDETDKFTKKLAKIPIVKEFFKHDNAMAAPELHLPQNVEEVRQKELFDGRLWYLGFRKPITHKESPKVTSLLQWRHKLESRQKNPV
ncbi:MAG: class I SAM-dependent methyltransferase [Firmicutes bacterium]|nr:class I SAM-dependent methyltransferase [Bacillota bacterium]